MDKSKELNAQIEELIKSSDLFLFMKGSPEMPQCGFSANSIAILNSLNVNYKTFNILEDMDIREGLKVYANWPTFPQLYLRGQLVGGNDIITEMYHSGELQTFING
ncbi:MAG: monothiol glutaredoxin, Grx4 family [Bacteriovorax sp. MedPE-SWde]|nr:MAG: monothiol glutaredoxin, Grx4 family [Bacteriovorax sp. MedPE-SWde]